MKPFDAVIKQRESAEDEALRKLQSDDQNELESLPRSIPSAPPHSDYHDGFISDFVDAISPHSEADPWGIYIHAVAMLGALFGPNPWVGIERTRHHCNEFFCFVGETSTGRKGTAYANAKELMPLFGPDGKETDRLFAVGLSSGEGLIHCVRDPLLGKPHTKEEKSEAMMNSEGLCLIDEGVPDKRLCVSAPEFAAVLGVLKRETNTLSAVLRQAWDCGTLAVMTRKDPLRSTTPHISIIAHCTKTDIVKYLEESDLGNGFTNRFIWICVEQSKIVPYTKTPLLYYDFSVFQSLASKATAFAQKQGRVELSKEADAVWYDYRMSEKNRDMNESVATVRAPAHCLRIALILAMADLSPEIGPKHLQSAMKIVDYSIRSARWVFGDFAGVILGPDEEKIMTWLDRPENSDGCGQSDVLKGCFGGNKSAEMVTTYLTTLSKIGRIRMEFRQGKTKSVKWITQVRKR